MSLSTTLKRARDDDDVAEAPRTQVAKIEPSLHPTHPYYILEHLVKNVLPEKCRHDNAKEFYKEQLDKPDEAVEICKSMLADWVLELWANGRLYRLERYAIG
jgi:hypothetical protein